MMKTKSKITIKKVTGNIKNCAILSIKRNSYTMILIEKSHKINL